MELKTLKIDSFLHEKLKYLADDKNTSMQNLIEKKLSELIAHEEDILFKFDKIEFSKKNEMYNLQLNETSFKKLINFFEIFLTNRNLKNINEIENLLKLIGDLKKQIVNSEIEDDEIEDEKIFSDIKSTDVKTTLTNFDTFLNSELNELINKKSSESVKDLYINTKNNINEYLNFINEKEKNANKTEEKIDTVDKDFNYDVIESRYKNTWLNQIVNFENSMEEFKKIEIEKAEKQLRSDYPKQISVFNIGDIIKNDKTELEYEIVKMYNSDEGISNLPINDYTPSENEILILKCISPLLKDIEAAFTYKQIIDIDFSKNGKLLSEIRNQIDSEYEKHIIKVSSIKKSATEVKSEIIKFKKTFIESSTYTNEETEKINNIINENLEKITNIVDKNIEYDEMKNMFMDVKRWFIETETEYNLNK